MIIDVEEYSWSYLRSKPMGVWVPSMVCIPVPMYHRTSRSRIGCPGICGIFRNSFKTMKSIFAERLPVLLKVTWYPITLNVTPKKENGNRLIRKDGTWHYIMQRNDYFIILFSWRLCKSRTWSRGVTRVTTAKKYRCNIGKTLVNIVKHFF